jgi:hypothetical protein
LTTPSALAQSVTYTFAGRVDTITPNLSGAFSPTDEIRGTFVFDPSAVGVACPFTGACMQYHSALQLMSATVGSYQLSGTITQLLQDGPLVDQYHLTAGASRGTPLVADPVNGFPLSVFQLHLVDNSQTALSGTGLVAPVLADYASPRWHLFFNNPDPNAPPGGIAVSGVITLLEPVAQSPIELIAELATKVATLNLQSGVSNAFDAKLDAVLAALEDSRQNNDVAAIGAIGAFIQSVEAQRGRQLTDTEADELIALAEQIIAALSG